MLTVLYYCLKVIICSGLLYGYYLLALRNNRFHQWNRYYLLAAVMVSFMLPFLKIPVPFVNEDEQPVVQSFRIIAAPDIYISKLQPQQYIFNWPVITELIYSFITIFLICLFIRNVLRLLSLKKRYPKENLNGIDFYNTKEPGTPFSFFKNIFWNSTISLNNEKGQQMLRHEITHIQEQHSVDKVAMELLIAFAWWNPFLYYIRKELSVIHEFIADQKASAGDDNLQYASLLLMKAMGSEQYTLGNPFFHSQLKRRLTMLTTIKNPKFSYIRRLMVLPLAAMAVTLFSFKYKPDDKVNNAVQQKRQPGQLLPEPDIETPLAVHGFYEDTTKKKAVIVKVKQRYKGAVIETVVPTNDLKGAVVKTADGSTYFLDRKEVKDSLGITITDKGWTAPKEAQVIYYDRAKSTYYSNKDAGAKISDSPLLGIIDYKNYGNKKALYIIDGKETPDLNINQVDPNTIKNVEVWTDKYATDQYGEKGKNGVIVITTKEPALPDGALYMIDDKEVTKEQAEKLMTSGVEKIDVWKGETAIKKFGEKGKNGVVVITTRLAKNEVTMPEAGQSDGLADITVIGYKTKPEFEAVFTKVEEPASFPGGREGWARYLERNLMYPEAAQKNNTQGEVKVKMTVDKEGFLSDIQALNNPGNGLAEEAVRVIAKGPKWIPAKQDGKIVKYTFVQTIRFGLQ